MKKLTTFLIVVIALVITLAFPLESINLLAGDSSLRQVTVYDNIVSHQVLTGAITVSCLMREIGIDMPETARTNHALNSPVWNQMTITIERKVNFIVRIDLLTIGVKSAWPNTTVEHMLIQLQNEKNLALIYDGDCSRQIIEGETLVFNTMRSQLKTEITIVPYETHENHTSSVWEGHTHVRQVGSTGEQRVTTKIVYIGGVEQSRNVVEKSIEVEPIDAIVDIGTARLGSLTDVTAPDFHYARRVRMEATAYTAGFGCTGKHPWDPWYRITASGRRVEHGIVAVDRRVIPLGTRLYVEGYGFAIAADVGGAIRGYKIDLFMENLQDALRFGRRHLYVWILE